MSLLPQILTIVSAFGLLIVAEWDWIVKRIPRPARPETQPEHAASERPREKGASIDGRPPAAESAAIEPQRPKVAQERERHSIRITARGWVAIALGLATLVGSWQALRQNANDTHEMLQSIQREGLRLQPSDFSLRLETWQHAGLVKSTSPPQSFELFGWVGPVSLRGTWQLIPERSHAVGTGGRNPNFHWDFVGRDMLVDGLAQTPYIDDLVGKEIRIVGPEDVFYSVSDSGIRYQIFLTIKGRQILLPAPTEKVDGPRVATQVLTRELLMGPASDNSASK